MHINEATEKARQILDEEIVRPTTDYEPSSRQELSDLNNTSSGVIALKAIADLGKITKLSNERKLRPRPVHEPPSKYKFTSTNYELLLALHSQVSEKDRPDFIDAILGRINEKLPISSSQRFYRFPQWNNETLDAPLIAEFSLRLGKVTEVLKLLEGAGESTRLLLFLMQLEETLSVSFNLLSDEEIAKLSIVLTDLKARAEDRTWEYKHRRGVNGLTRVANPKYSRVIYPVATQIVSVAVALIEQCRTARYLYLKGALQQRSNIEINLDKASVEEYLGSLGFSQPLRMALNAAEQDYRDTATPFELKNCLAHLRSFLESLHTEAHQAVCRSCQPKPTKWGEYLNHLRTAGLLSKQEETFVAGLYILLSDEGVHPLQAEREYARLLRNMVIEYGLMFLSKLSRMGVVLSNSQRAASP